MVLPVRTDQRRGARPESKGATGALLELVLGVTAARDARIA